MSGNPANVLRFAAIAGRELGRTAIVGTGDGTHVLHGEQAVTLSGAGGGEGVVHAGIAQISAEEQRIGDLPQARMQIMLILANPAATFRWWRLPVDGGQSRAQSALSSSIAP